jgi:hypothetical protein
MPRKSNGGRETTRSSDGLSDQIPQALGDRPKNCEFCDIMAQNPEPGVYKLVSS